MPESLYIYRWQILLILLGLLFVSVGIFFNRAMFTDSTVVEIVDDVSKQTTNGTEIVVDVSGSVVNPGVYKLANSSRIADALNIAGGVTGDANTEWMSKYLNQAAVLSDGQKIYIPSQSEVLSANDNVGSNNGSSGQVNSSLDRVNINTASLSELESLWGIGPVTAQKVVEQRMYTSVEELLSKGVINKNVYERNKDLLTVY